VNRRAPILVGVGFAVLVALSVFLLVLPKSAEIAKTQEDLTAAEQQENTLRIELRALQEAQDEAPQTRTAIQRVETQIPPTARPSTFSSSPRATRRSIPAASSRRSARP
jgi:type II secretory pathway component PulM